MKTKIKTIGLSALLGVALLGSSASADILFSAPGIPLYPLSEKETAGNGRTLNSGEFYAYRVLGVYSTLRIESGPWDYVSGSILGNLVNGTFKAMEPMIVTSCVKINGQPIGQSNVLSTNSIDKLSQTVNQFNLEKDIVSGAKEPQQVKFNVSLAVPEKVVVSGHIGIKAQYIPVNIKARGSVRVGQFVAGSFPRVYWSLVKSDMFESFDPGARLAAELPRQESPKVGNPVVADDSVTVIGKSNMTTQEVVPDKQGLGLGGKRPLVYDPTR